MCRKADHNGIMTEELLIVESYVYVKQLAQLILTVITFTNTQDWSSSSDTLRQQDKNNYLPTLSILPFFLSQINEQFHTISMGSFWKDTAS